MKTAAEKFTQDASSRNTGTSEGIACAPKFERFQVFTGGQGGYANYRCPALVRTAKGTLLLSPDARNSRSDWGWIDLLITRSTDGGHTWSAPQILNQYEDDGRPTLNRSGDKIPNRENAPTMDASKAITASNQCLIPDADGRIHLLYFIEYCRAFYRVSEDDGISWSKPVEITASAFEPFRPDYPWKVIAAGPGAGIQLSQGKHRGRLIAPCWMSRGGAEHGGDHRPSVTMTIYSDDGGKTWRPGAINAHHNERLVNPSENVLVELSDGRVMVNIRSESQAHRRAISISDDGISNWSPLDFSSELWEPVCHAGLIRMAGVTGHGRTLVFSNPDTQHKPEHVNMIDFCIRENVSVRLSFDDGKSWTVKRSVEPEGMSGYSALTHADDGTIWCAFEHKTADGPWNISVASFNLAWVTGKE